MPACHYSVCRVSGATATADAPRAQAINELPKVVQDYEAGKAIPNQQVRTPPARRFVRWRRDNPASAASTRAAVTQLLRSDGSF